MKLLLLRGIIWIEVHFILYQDKLTFQIFRIFYLIGWTQLSPPLNIEKKKQKTKNKYKKKVKKIQEKKETKQNKTSKDINKVKSNKRKTNKSSIISTAYTNLYAYKLNSWILFFLDWLFFNTAFYTVSLMGSEYQLPAVTEISVVSPFVLILYYFFPIWTAVL